MEYKPISNLQLFQKIWNNLYKVRRRQLLIAFCLMIASGMGEMFSLAAVIPFLSVLNDPNKIFEIKILNNFLKFLKINEVNQLIFAATSLFIIAVLISATIRLFNIYFS